MLRPRLAWTIIVTAALAFSAAGPAALAAVPGLSPTPPTALQGKGASPRTAPSRSTAEPHRAAAVSAELPRTGPDLPVQALVALSLLGIGAALRGARALERGAA